MFSGPIRGGTRGGQGDFKWSDVAEDKDRENYLGHSILAPVGRWQKNRDITWYNNNKNDSNLTEEQIRVQVEEAKREEIRKVKEAEEDALSLALGFKPTPRGTTSRQSEVASTSTAQKEDEASLQRAKAERKAERAAHRLAKEERKRHKADKKLGRLDDERNRERRRSRSKSPARRDVGYEESRRGDRERNGRRFSRNTDEDRRDGYRTRRRSRSR